jgi:hypothetical protein
VTQESPPPPKQSRLLTFVAVALAAATVLFVWVRNTKTPGVPNAARGDVNGDGRIDARDVEYLSKFLYASGPAPLGNGDVNGDGKVDTRDLLYLTNYVQAGGPGPVGPDGRPGPTTAVPRNTP